MSNSSSKTKNKSITSSTATTNTTTTSNSLTTVQSTKRKRGKDIYNDNSPKKKATPTTNKNSRTRASEIEHNNITNSTTTSTAITTAPITNSTFTIEHPTNPFTMGPRDWGAATTNIAKNNAKNTYVRKLKSITAEHRRKNNNCRKEKQAKNNLPSCPDKPVATPIHQPAIKRTFEKINEDLGEEYEPPRKFYAEEHQEYKKRKREQENVNKGGDSNGNNDFDNLNVNVDFLMMCNSNESHKSDDLGYNGGEDFIG